MTTETLERANKIQSELAELRQSVRVIQQSDVALYLEDLGEELFKELKELALEKKDAEIGKLSQEFSKL